jgi:hypothetical protein
MAVLFVAKKVCRYASAMAGGKPKRKKKLKRANAVGDSTFEAPLVVNVALGLSPPMPESVPFGRPRPGEGLGFGAQDWRGGGTYLPEGAALGPEWGFSHGAGPSWPLGPHYLRWVEGRGVHAWARFKLKSADWYLGVLEAAEREGGLDRYVGVEMAIDGALASLVASIDAAGHGLARELDGCLGPGVVDPQRCVWEQAVALANERSIDLGCERELARALGADASVEGAGWLVELRQLKDAAVRHNVLVRPRSLEGHVRGRLLDVPAVGPRPVLAYLSCARRHADGLVEALLGDLAALAGQRHARAREPRAQQNQVLPDLSARAAVVPPKRQGPGHL